MTSEVFNTDCLEYMRTLPDKAFQLAIADPPYGINAPNMKMGENKGYVSTATKCKKGRLNSGGGKLKNRVLNQSDCSWDCEPPKQEFFDELFRVCENVIIWGGNYFPLADIAFRFINYHEFIIKLSMNYGIQTTITTSHTATANGHGTDSGRNQDTEQHRLRV